MNVTHLDQLLMKQLDAIHALKESTDGVIQTICRFGSPMENFPEHDMTKWLKELCRKQHELLGMLEAYPSFSMKECQDMSPLSVSIHTMTGEVVTFGVGLLSPVSEIRTLFFQKKGYINSYLEEVFHVSFFYQDHQGEQVFLHKTDTDSCYERFGHHVPVIHFLIEPPSDDLRHQIMTDFHEYLELQSCFIAADEDTFWEEYLLWFKENDISIHDDDHVRLMCETYGDSLFPLKKKEKSKKKSKKNREEQRREEQRREEQRREEQRREEEKTKLLQGHPHISIPVPDDGCVHLRHWNDQLYLVNHEYFVWQYTSDQEVGDWVGIFRPRLWIMDTSVPEPEYYDAE